MTSSDAPQPPGGSQRQDAPEGGFAPDADHDHLAEGSTGHGSDDDADVPPVTRSDDTDGGEAQQSQEDAALQEENAETSADQPSS